MLVTNIHELRKNFQALKTVQEVDKMLGYYLNRLAVRTFAFTAFQSKKVVYEFTSANFAAWHKHYHEQNYLEIDTTASKAHHSNTPELWTIREQIEQATTKREYQMRLDADKFGAVKGVSIPVHSFGVNFSELVVVQMKNESFLDSLSTTLVHELMILVQYYYQYLCAVNDSSFSKSSNGLNPRQLQCLLLTAKGYSLQEIAAQMRIKERTVNYHLQNINKILGTKNKYLSIKEAQDLGLLTHTQLILNS